jgi:hypothetical protein
VDGIPGRFAHGLHEHRLSKKRLCLGDRHRASSRKRPLSFIIRVGDGRGAKRESATKNRRLVRLGRSVASLRGIACQIALTDRS